MYQCFVIVELFPGLIFTRMNKFHSLGNPGVRQSLLIIGVHQPTVGSIQLDFVAVIRLKISNKFKCFSCDRKNNVNYLILNISSSKVFTKLPTFSTVHAN